VKYSVFSHCQGDVTVPQLLQSEVMASIRAVNVKVAKRAAPKIRDALMSELIGRGWSAEAEISGVSRITVTSMKSKLGLCLQTGNVSRMYADLLKLQKLYMDGAIIAAAMIVPTRACARELGDNLVNANRLERELEIFRKVIHLPILVYSFE
jgi:hypothetical protein